MLNLPPPLAIFLPQVASEIRSVQARGKACFPLLRYSLSTTTGDLSHWKRTAVAGDTVSDTGSDTGIAPRQYDQPRASGAGTKITPCRAHARTREVKRASLPFWSTVNTPRRAHAHAGG